MHILLINNYKQGFIYPLVYTYTMKQSLTTEEVDSIIGAIEIAEDESGGDYSDIKSKLLLIYPKVQTVRQNRDRKWRDESDKQQKARKALAKEVFDGLEMFHLIIPQLQDYVRECYDLIRKHYSDEICLSADLFKYHLADLKRFGLINEIKKYIKEESEVIGNEWMATHYKDEPDSQLWHVLARKLESARRD